MSPDITSATSALIARKGWDTEMEVLQIPVKVGSARLATHNGNDFAPRSQWGEETGEVLT